jgi:uncharacterized repeat protein (TIGR01451 family)
VGPNGNDAAQLRNPNYAGSLLSNLITLTYSTYVTTNINEQAVYIILNVDYTGDGASDDLLFFEPVYQEGAFCPSNPQAPTVLLGVWQFWDARNGCWYSLNGVGPSAAGSVVPLSTILAAQPNARIASTGAGAGAVRLVAGFGAGAWDNFVGNADAFSIDFTGDALDLTTYDFEPAPLPTSTPTATTTSTVTPTSTSTSAPIPTTTPGPGIDLTVTKSASAPSVAPNGTLTYTLTARNSGQFATGANKLRDPLPAQTTLLSVGPNCYLLTGAVWCNVPYLPKGGQATFTFAVRVNSGASGSIVNTVEIDANKQVTENNESNNTFTLMTPVSP